METIIANQASEKASPCGHGFHSECLSSWLSSLIKDGHVASVRCPSCPRALEASEVEAVVSPEEYSRYQVCRSNFELSADPRTRWCAHPGCGAPIPYVPSHAHRLHLLTSFLYHPVVHSAVKAAALGGGLGWGYSATPLAVAVGVLSAFAGSLAGVGLSGRALFARCSVLRGWEVKCPRCLLPTCFDCRLVGHSGKSCGQSSLNQLSSWASLRDVTDCPKCNMVIERVDGCNHVTCTVW